MLTNDITKFISMIIKADSLGNKSTKSIYNIYHAKTINDMVKSKECYIFIINSCLIY